MSSDASDHNLKAIRQLLLAAFTPEELRRFCYDRPTFRPVVKRFGPKSNQEDMVDELIIYCDTRLLFDELLAEVQPERSRQYAFFLGAEPGDGESEEPAEEKPAQSSPEVLTIDDSSVRETKETAKAKSAQLTLEIPSIPGPISLDFVHVAAGEFLMGSALANDRDAQDFELPPHHVYLPDFYIGRYPVTNSQYQAFVQAARHWAPSHWRRPGIIHQAQADHPVVNVAWHDAVSFCNWLSREIARCIRLPTEAEWEKSARGVDGRIYPWGNQPPEPVLSNFGRNLDHTTPVGRYSPQGDSPYDCADMAGNVWEWCQSLSGSYPYQADDGREALEVDGYRVLRGGSFYASQRDIRCACRMAWPPLGWGREFGFRVVLAPTTSSL
jgi:formylglycine-generating enzyme required for sulfatase activity